MADENLIRQLLQEIMVSDRTLEDVCRDHPELLNEVRARWGRVRVVEQQLDALFPPSGSTARDTASIAMDGALPQIAGYEVREILGHGGMGVVYKARHVSLNRDVAIKMLLAGAYASAPERQRLLREAQAVAALRHPNVVTVFDVGEIEHRPYFTMELLDGNSLAKRLAGQPLPAHESAALVARLAEAMHSAHQAGIIHRDLKPANVLFAADGTPKITDFGLARHFDSDSCVTLTGVRIGTPSYMAPEQARGQHEHCGIAVDIYALGAVLYETLTGRPPFRADTAMETQRQVIEEEPAPPSHLNARVPRDLETICLTCLSKEPGKRYASAAALAADLSRFLKGEPILARRAGFVERAGKWMRRHPSATISAIAAMVVFAITLAGAVWIIGSRSEVRRAVNVDLAESIRYQRAGDWHAARDALERAQGRLGQASFPDLRRRVDGVRNDLELVAKLGDIRLSRAMVAGGFLDWKKAERDYRDAFVAAGLNLHELAATVAAERIANSPIRAPLVAALDDWSISASQPAERSRVLEVARLADPDPQWRDHVRDESTLSDAAALTRLATSANIAQQPVPVLVMLSCRLSAAGGDAVAFCRRIQREFPGDFWANYNLATQLDKWRNPEAITYYLAALAIRPNALSVYINLSSACAFHGRDAEALEYDQRAVQLDPHSAIAHFNLATALLADDRAADAIAECQKTLQIDPTYASAQGVLASAYIQQNRFVEANAAINRCLELMSPDDPNRAFAELLAGSYVSLLHHESRLPEVLAGRETPDPKDRCALASICYIKRQYSDAVRLYREAFAADPGVGQGLDEDARLTAACAAARASSDVKGTKDEAVGDHARLVGDALAWLNADLAAWTAVLREKNEPGRIALMQKLNRWKNRKDLAPIREPDLLRELSDEQQTKCRALWRKVDRLIQEAVAAAP